MGLCFFFVVTLLLTTICLFIMCKLATLPIYFCHLLWTQSKAKTLVEKSDKFCLCYHPIINPNPFQVWRMTQSWVHEMGHMSHMLDFRLQLLQTHTHTHTHILHRKTQIKSCKGILSKNSIVGLPMKCDLAPSLLQRPTIFNYDP